MTAKSNQPYDIGVLGAGSWGTALAILLSKNGHNIHLWEFREEAAKIVVNEQLKEIGGNGGVICLDKNGNYAMVFNTEGMYRGVKQKGKKMEIYIY